MKHPRLLCLTLLLAFNVSALAVTTSENLQPNEQNTIHIFERAAPLVVNVHKINHVVNLNYDFIPVETGSGSGFLWDKQHIVTNYHVIQGANEVVVTFQNGQKTEAKIVGTYPRKDIAVLSIPENKAIKNVNIIIADSSTLKVGQDVIAIGNPFGLEHTLTRGIVSALHREIPSGRGGMLRDLIQTDASINPGNSGGPLLNSRGEIIGMNTAIFSTSGSSAGIGFAIMANDIKRVVNQIIQVGKVSKASIGVMILEDSFAHQLGVDGVVINRVLPQTPAAQAGLRGTIRNLSGNIILGDIIVGMNGKSIHKTSDLMDQLENLSVDDTIKLSILRQGKMKNMMIKPKFNT